MRRKYHRVIGGAGRKRFANKRRPTPISIADYVWLKQMIGKLRRRFG